MNCDLFEKWLKDNPGRKELPAEMGEHLSSCHRCRALWKVEELLLECPGTEEKLFLPPQMKSHLLAMSRKQVSRRISLMTLVEDSFIQALVMAVFLGGAAAALPKLAGSRLMESVRPQLGPLVDFLGPLFSRMVAFLQVPGGAYLFAFMVFATALSFEVYYKAFHPRSAYSSF